MSVRRAVRIETGYGLEGAITDLHAKRIISEIIIPQFKAGQFYAGVRDGVDVAIFEYGFKRGQEVLQDFPVVKMGRKASSGPQS